MSTMHILSASSLVPIIIFFIRVVKNFPKIDILEKHIDTLEKQIDKILDNEKTFFTDLRTLKEFKIIAKKFIDNQIYKSKNLLALTELGVKLVKEKR
jgi:uncharacterized protein YoxC